MHFVRVFFAFVLASVTIAVAYGCTVMLGLTADFNGILTFVVIAFFLGLIARMTHWHWLRGIASSYFGGMVLYLLAAALGTLALPADFPMPAVLGIVGLVLAGIIAHFWGSNETRTHEDQQARMDEARERIRALSQQPPDWLTRLRVSALGWLGHGT